MRHRQVWLLVAAAAACTSAPTETGDKGPEQTPFEVVFEGNSSIGSSSLREAIADLLIDFGRNPSRESAIFDAASDLDDYYLDLGFPEAEVQYHVERDPRLKVVFTIREGPRVTVSKVRLTGNEFFSDDELLPLWRRERSGLLALGDPYFVEEDLRALVFAIRGRYTDQGFLDVEVDGPLVQRDQGADTAAVSFTIREGVRYRLAAVQISDELAPHAGALDLSLIGKPYDPLTLRSRRVALREALRAAGYPDPTIRLDVEVDHRSKQVTAKISGSTGPRERIVSIRIAGNDRTAEHVIRNKVEFAVGEWFNGPEVDRTVSNLYLSGLFQRVEIEREERAPGEVELTVRVEEIDAHEIGLLAGYGSYEKVRGAIILGDRNLFGLGQRIRTVTHASTKSWGGDTTWTEPEVLGTRTNLSVTTFLEEREEPAYTDFTWGTSAALSRRLFEYTQARVGYSYQLRDARNVDPLQSLANNHYRLGTVFTELSRDNRDSQIYPTTGHRELVRYELAATALGGEVDFSRVIARIDWHHSFAEDWILTLAAEGGWIWPGNNEIVPVQERFYNGGQSTVRSFRQDKLGPRTISGVPAGGEYRNVFNVELRYPIFRMLKGAVFGDAGNVGLDVHDYGLSEMRYAVGAGLRLALPIGPVRFDVGWNPDPKSYERNYTMHLAVGLPF